MDIFLLNRKTSLQLRKNFGIVINLNFRTLIGRRKAELLSSL